MQETIIKLDHTGNSGELKSVNFPSSYSNNIDTTETIRVDAGSKIKITFSSLSIESQETCTYDYVTVVDGDGTVLLEKTCGNIVPGWFKSKTNMVNVIFHTDYSVTKPGWKLSWSQVLPRHGVVKSPNYPSNYGNNMDETYTIEVAAGRRISIDFASFTIESHGTCDYDYVMITVTS